MTAVAEIGGVTDVNDAAATNISVKPSNKTVMTNNVHGGHRNGKSRHPPIQHCTMN